MLSKSEDGVRGLTALFDFYQTNYGLDAEALVHKHGCSISVEDIPYYSGRLSYEEKRVIVSRENPPLLREFVIFHEMAHYCLHPIAPVFGVATLQVDKADDIEYWCDHFALAMFFGRRNARLIYKDIHISFLTHGNEAAYDGRDSISPWRQSAVLSKRIPHMTRTFFKRNEAAYLECVVLQYALLLVSKLVRLREEVG